MQGRAHEKPRLFASGSIITFHYITIVMVSNMIDPLYIPSTSSVGLLIVLYNAICFHAKLRYPTLAPDLRGARIFD